MIKRRWINALFFRKHAVVTGALKVEIYTEVV